MAPIIRVDNSKSSHISSHNLHYSPTVKSDCDTSEHDNPCLSAQGAAQEEGSGSSKATVRPAQHDPKPRPAMKTSMAFVPRALAGAGGTGGGGGMKSNADFRSLLLKKKEPPSGAGGN
eukprot:1172993-Prorocentrum_minimum.AAC.2